MADTRLHLPRSMPTYLVRAPLVRRLRELMEFRGRLPVDGRFGSRASDRVSPASRMTACLGMLLAMYLDLRRMHLGLLAKPIVVAEVPR